LDESLLITESGMSLLEILVVLALIGLFMLAMATGLGGRAESDLRSSSLEVMALLRASHARAMGTGTHHRLVFDLDAQSMQIEQCQGVLGLRKVEEDENEDVLDAKGLADLREPPVSGDVNQEILAAASPEKALEVAAALKGENIGSARCNPSEGFTGDADGKKSQRKIKGGANLKIRAVHVQHIKEPVTEGKVSINFFPLGHGEKAAIELANEDKDKRTVLVHGLTGKTEIANDDLDIEDHMRRNARGDEIDEER